MSSETCWDEIWSKISWTNTAENRRNSLTETEKCLLLFSLPEQQLLLIISCSARLLALALRTRSAHPSLPSQAIFPQLYLPLPLRTQPSSACNQNSTGGCRSVAGPDGTAWALALFIIHARPSLPRSFLLFLPSIPSSSLLLSQRAMDLLEGITEEAWCYRAYIRMDAMQEGEVRAAEEKWRDEDLERK